MIRILLLCLVASCLLTACSSRIEGETTSPPPAGGPTASSDHPPGENPDVIADDRH